jgi:integrase
MTVNKRGKTWQYRVSYVKNPHAEDPKEKYDIISKGGFRTKKECEIAEKELKDKLDRGYDIGSAEQLFADYVLSWFEIYKKGKFSAGHEANVKRAVKSTKVYFPGVRLKDVTRDMYQKFLNTLAQKLHKDTVKKYHVVLRAALKDAIQSGAITRDPTYKAVVSGAKASKDEDLKYLNIAELTKLANAITSSASAEPLVEHLLLLLLATGLRYSEAVGLTWDCVDTKNGAVTVNKSWDFKSGKFAHTKTYGSQRTITIDKSTREMMDKVLLLQKAIGLRSGLKNEHNLCFLDERFNPIGNSTANAALKKYCGMAGVKVITCHSLRHTHASTLLYKGVNVKYISRRLGHADIKMTLQTYSHILDEMEQLETRRVDDIISGLLG